MAESGRRAGQPAPRGRRGGGQDAGRSSRAVKVTESVRRGMTVVELSTAPGDMGKIIGRQGRTAAAIRTLVALTAERHGVRAQLDIRD